MTCRAAPSEKEIADLLRGLPAIARRPLVSAPGAASVAGERVAGIAGHRAAASYRRPPENRRLTQCALGEPTRRGRFVARPKAPHSRFEWCLKTGAW